MKTTMRTMTVEIEIEDVSNTKAMMEKIHKVVDRNVAAFANRYILDCILLGDGVWRSMDSQYEEVENAFVTLYVKNVQAPYSSVLKPNCACLVFRAKNIPVEDQQS